MPEETQVTATPPEAEKPKAEVKPESTPAEVKNTEHMIPKSRLDEEIQKRKDLETQAQKDAQRLKEFEAAEQKRREAEMSEAEKVQARIKELEAANIEKDQRIKQREYADLQTKVAKAVAKELNIPFDAVEELANRLIGETEEQLAEDAKKIFAVLPKQETKPDNKLSPKLEPTNPGDGKKGETRAQTRARIMGAPASVWSKDGAEDRGGGVMIVEKG